MEGKNSMIGFKECVRTLVADRVYYLTTEEKQTPQFAPYCALHDILLEMWSICHNDTDPSDISSELYDQLHDQASDWADVCLKEVKHA